jgi:hypothetical protein
LGVFGLSSVTVAENLIAEFSRYGKNEL